ncbi:MAG: DUF2281 domain-containing protein [Agitococcus sp.]|nr:DUF2281 domain-containing protein [Agitococcus sp.]
MSITQTLQAHIQALPAVFQSEVLDFVEYLEKKYGIGLAEKKADNAQTDAFIARMAYSLGDDFPDDVNDLDLGEDSAKDAIE